MIRNIDNSCGNGSCSTSRFFVSSEVYKVLCRENVKSYSLLFIHCMWECPSDSSRLTTFALLAFVVGLKKFAPYSYPIRKKHQKQSWLPRAHFPARHDGYMYLVRVLIESLEFLCPLWLTRVIILVLGLRHNWKQFYISFPSSSPWFSIWFPRIKDVGEK